MSTADKLNKILASKEAIRQSIINKGTDVGTNVPLSQYASKIDEIQTTPSEYENPDFYEMRTNGGTNYEYLFYNYNGKNNDNSFLELLDTSKVINMEKTFSNSYFTSLDLTGWDVSKVTNMQNMFDYSNITELNVTGWDVSKVTNMYYMFNNNTMTTISGIEKWDVSSVTNMEYMFNRCYFNSLDLSEWDVSSVTNMSGMFNESNLETLNISGWDTSNVTNFGSINWFIRGGASYASNASRKLKLVIGELDLASCTSGMYYSSSYYCFQTLPNLELLYLKNIYKNVTMTNNTKFSINLGDTIIKDECLVSIINELPDLINDKGLTDTSAIVLTLPPTNTLRPSQVKVATDKGWNVANVNEDIPDIEPIMFTSLGSTQLVVNGEDVAGQVQEVVSEVSLLSEGQPILYQYTPSSDITQVSFMYNQDLVEVIQLDTSKVENMSDMFNNCWNLQSIPDIDVSSAKYMNNMFYNCWQMRGYADPNKYWNNPNVLEFNYCFNNCQALDNEVPEEWIQPMVPLERLIIANNEGYYIFDSSITFENGVDSYQFHAAYKPENTTQIGIRWMSDNESIATIDEHGLLTRIGYGDVNIACISTDNPDIKTTLLVTFVETESGGDASVPTESSRTIMFTSYGDPSLVVNSNDVTDDVELYSEGENGLNTYRYKCPEDIVQARFCKLSGMDEDGNPRYVPNTNLHSVLEMDMSKVKIMYYTFLACTGLVSVTGMDTSNVENMGGVFMDCTSLSSFPVLNLSSNHDGIGDLFRNCTSLTTADFTEWNLSNVNNMGGLFMGCTNLTEVIGLNTSGTYSMGSMFRDTGLLAIPDIDMSSAGNVRLMFSGCSSLTGYADPDKFWNNPNLNGDTWNHNGCFKGCTSLSNYDDMPDSWKTIIEE